MGGGGGVGDHCTIFFKNQHLMIITNKSTFYSVHFMYAFINVGNLKQPLN